jgi:HEAT repeat protein
MAANSFREPALTPALKPLLTHGEREVRALAAIALGEVGDRSALKVLTEEAGNPKSPFNIMAGLALLRFGRNEAEVVASAALRDGFLASLACNRLLQTKNPNIRAFATRHFRDEPFATLRGREGEVLEVLERAAILGDKQALRNLLIFASDKPEDSRKVQYVRTGNRSIPLALAASVCLARLEQPKVVLTAARELQEELKKPGNAGDRRRDEPGLAELIRAWNVGLKLADRFSPAVRKEILRNRELNTLEAGKPLRTRAATT